MVTYNTLIDAMVPRPGDYGEPGETECGWEGGRGKGVHALFRALFNISFWCSLGQHNPCTPLLYALHPLAALRGSPYQMARRLPHSDF